MHIPENGIEPRMPTVEELVVSLREEGMDDTVQGMERVEGQFDETAEAVGDSADEMGGFAARWRGAMTAILGGLAIAASGLLSRVPVIGETVAMLSGILDGLAFQIDKALRPSMSKLNQDLAKVQTKVFNAQGPFDALVKAVLGVNNAFDDFSVSAIQSAIKNLTGIKLPRNMLDFFYNLVTLDFIGMAEAIKTQFDRSAKFLNQWFPSFKKDVKQGFGAAVEGIKEIMGALPGAVVKDAKKIWKGVTKWFGNLVSDVSSSFGDLVSSATSWGTDLIDNIVQGIKNAIPDLSSLLDQDIAAGMSISDIESGSLDILSGLSGGGNGGNTVTAQRNQSNNLFLNGRILNDQQGRYEDDTNSRRGLF